MWEDIRTCLLSNEHLLLKSISLEIPSSKDYSNWLFSQKSNNAYRN
jgi:hypothetical protein